MITLVIGTFKPATNYSVNSSTIQLNDIDSSCFSTYLLCSLFFCAAQHGISGCTAPQPQSEKAGSRSGPSVHQTHPHTHCQSAGVNKSTHTEDFYFYIFQVYNLLDILNLNL